MAHLRFLYCALTAGLSVFTLTTHGAGPCEREKVLAWDGGNNFARFGYSLGLNDDLLLVGSPRHSVAGFGAGSILLYRSSPDGWLADGKLWASDSAQSDYFGLVFDVKEGRVITGAPGNDDLGAESGSAYIFELAGDEWVETKLLAPDGAMSDLFGRSVGISGDFAVIGAHGDDDNGLSSGSAYIFRKIDGEWLFTQKLLPSDGAAEHRFGLAAAMDGQLALVGAESHDSAGPNTGAAYVFRYDSRRDEWAEEAILIAGDADSYDWFGNSVALDGEVALIGAYGEYNSRPGAAYVFEYQPASGEWIETAKLTASDGQLNDFFGQSVSIDEDVAIIGADGDDDLGADAGAAYIFTRDPGQSTWTEQRKLVASDGDEDDWFGRAVAVQGYIAVCGAPQDEDQAIDGGSAYGFDLLACLCTADVDGNGAVGVADLLAVLSGWGQPGGPQDVNRDGVVNVRDLLLVLASWGPCALRVSAGRRTLAAGEKRDTSKSRSLPSAPPW